MFHVDATPEQEHLQAGGTLLTSCRRFLFQVSAFLLEFMFWKAEGDSIAVTESYWSLNIFLPPKYLYHYTKDLI